MSLLLALTASGGGAVSYTLTCDAGVYTCTGNDASLKQARSLALVPGAYSLSGKAAMLTYTPGAAVVNYTLACATGAYEYAGKAATLTYASGAASASKSGVNRLWLIEYYTKAFAKAEPVKTTGVSKATQNKRQAQRDAAIETQVAKAERDLEALSQGISNAQAAQAFTQQLITQAQVALAPEFDFMSVAVQYRERIREDDDELLLLAMII